MSEESGDPKETGRGMQRSRKVALPVLAIVGAIIAVVFAFGLPPFSNDPVPTGGHGEERTSGVDEKPFFLIDKNASGPLTLAELQINIPAELDRELTTQRRACFLRKIGELAAEAGDPETLDPSNVAYLPTDGSWDDLTTFNKRLILAQAIVSRAITYC